MNRQCPLPAVSKQAVPLAAGWLAFLQVHIQGTRHSTRKGLLVQLLKPLWAQGQEAGLPSKELPA